MKKKNDTEKVIIICKRKIIKHFRIRIIFSFLLKEGPKKLNLIISTFLFFSYFESYIVSDFARSGNLAITDVEVKSGPLLNFPHSMEPQLRQLGLPTTLKKGELNLISLIHLMK